MQSDHGNSREEENAGVCPPKDLSGFVLSDREVRPSDLSDHLATKNVIKKMFYQMLVKRTGKAVSYTHLDVYKRQVLII